MSTERSLDPNLKNSLVSGESFLYAHLIKFERTVKTLTARPSEDATDYAYISDASFNIVFDDGSKNVSGVSNGAQTYSANRVLSVGDVNETTDAKASSLALGISSEALNTRTDPSQVISFTATDTTTLLSNIITTGTSFIDLGFSEGDDILIKHDVAVANQDTNHNKSATIVSFSNNNKTISCKIHGATTDGSTVTGGLVSVTSNNHEIYIDSSHIISMFSDRTSNSYAGYINREVFIYKAHINPATGLIIGAPYLVFKGIIAKAKVTEDPEKSSKITWTLTSHWGDFIRVNGRVTSDSEHRALGGNGSPDVVALHRHEYAGDLGFMHSEQAINIISIYQVMETRYKMKSSGLFGLKKKMVEYQVEVDRDVDLRLNLEAKHLPIIYGVQRTDSIPIFADSHATNSGEIYVIYAICEGEISGILDMYINDQSRICIDGNDADTRGTQTPDKTIDVICMGRMDRGDTLSSTPAYNRGARSIYGYAGQNSGIAPTFSGPFGIPQGYIDYLYGLNSGTASIAPNAATGLTHEKKTNYTYPIEAEAVFHAGRSHQKADSMILNIAKQGATPSTANSGFKLQKDHSEDPQKYWTSQHRLLDTAYMAVKYTIAEGDVEIPEIDFVVRGREIEQFNYDYSYSSIPEVQGYSGYNESDQADNFNIGDQVAFYTVGGSIIAQALVIMDKYVYTNAREESINKFRFNINPLRKSPELKEFIMVPYIGSGFNDTKKYHFETWDRTSLSGVVPSALTDAIDTTTSNTSTGTLSDNSGGTAVNLLVNAQTAAGQRLKAFLDFIGSGGFTFSFGTNVFNFNLQDFEQYLDTYIAEYNNGIIEDISNTTEGQAELTAVFITNAIQLQTDASSLNDFYKGQTIKVTHTNADGTIKVQTRRIVKYQGSTRIATTGSLTPVTATNTSGISISNISQVSYSNLIPVNLTHFNATNVGDVLTITSGQGVLPENTSVIEKSASGNILKLSTSQVFLYAGTTISIVRAGALDFVIEPEPFDFIPRAGDKYEILPVGDKKVSINPAIQLLDYITNKRFGRGLDLEKDIDLESFKLAARLCDTRSDVTIFSTSTTNATAGDIYKYIGPNNGKLFWQGTVKSVTSRTYSSVVYEEIVFTDCIGKLIQKWENWRHVETDQLIWKYHGNTNKSRVHRAHADGTYVNLAVTDYALTSATDIVITRALNKKDDGVTSATGNTTFNPWFSLSDSTQVNASDDNPLVKAWDVISSTPSVVGYSLYDCDELKYWRYAGWQEKHQREVTRHQTNAVMRSETPLFDNVNSLLEHFNGILRYVNGKYQLDVETSSTEVFDGIYSITVTSGGSGYTSVPDVVITGNKTTAARAEAILTNGVVTSISIILPGAGYINPGVTLTGGGGSGATATIVASADPRVITQDDIIGSITVDDAGLKGSANTVSVGIPDPQIRFDKRSVVFFDSVYLKEDRGIPKKKDVKTPLITNYFNARINAEQFLRQSRSSKKINFQLGPKGALLLPGTIIKLTYPRFGWDNKLYRISNVNIKQDCLVQLTAMEHDDTTYLISGKKKNNFASENTANAQAANPIIQPPFDLATTNNIQAKIKLTWKNNSNFALGTSTGIAGWSTEVWYSDSISFGTATTNFPSGAIPIATNLTSSDWEHDLTDISSNTTYYYWIKHRATAPTRSGKNVQVSSVFHPTSTSNGIQGVATAIVGNATISGIVYLYRVVDQGASTPTIPSGFDSVRVTLDGGSNHGKITSVPSSTGALYTDSNSDTYPGLVQVRGSYGFSQWYLEKPPITGSKVRYVVAATTLASGGTFDDIARTEWSDPVQESGSHGVTSTVVTIYQRTNSSSAPAVPSGQLTYNFNTGTLLDAAGGSIAPWSLAEEPAIAGNAYIWKTTAAAVAVTNSVGNTTDIIDGTASNSSDWAAPILFHQFAPAGANSNVPGPNGQSAVTVYLYKQATSTPAKPGTISNFPSITYFTSGSNTGKSSTDAFSTATSSGSNGWFAFPPSTVTLNNTVYICAATASGVTTDVVSSSEWTDAIQYTGFDGIQNTTVSAYRLTNSSTAPNKPQTVATHTFANNTNVWANSNQVDSAGWSFAPLSPTSSNTYVWICTAPAFGRGATDTIAIGDWSAPKIFSERVPGGVGTDGLKTANGYLYFTRTTNTNPLPQGGSASYTFGTGLVTGNITVTGSTSSIITDSNYTNEPTGIDIASNFYFVARYSGQQASTSDSTATVAITPAVVHTSFTGVVTFTDGTFKKDGVTTVIDGANIDTGTIKATQLEISNNTGNGSGIFFSSSTTGADNFIQISDANAVRVKIGKL